MRQSRNVAMSDEKQEKRFYRQIFGAIQTENVSTSLILYGEMAERSNAAVLKTVDGQLSGGSNPSLSANQNLNRTLAVWFRFFVYKNSVRIGVFRLWASQSYNIQVFVQKVISFCSTIEIRAFQSKNPT